MIAKTVTPNLLIAFVENVFASQVTSEMERFAFHNHLVSALELRKQAIYLKANKRVSRGVGV